MKPVRLALLASVAVLAASLAAASGVSVPRSGERVAAPSDVVADQSLPVTFRCEDCSGAEAPTVALLWRDPSAAGGELRRTLTTLDWQAGRFTLSGSEAIELQGEPIDGGWSVDVPLQGLGRPMRVSGGVEGFVATQAVFYPADRAGEPVAYEMKRLGVVLESNPGWDPARSAECELQVPKGVELPIVLTSDDQPRAWLFPTPQAGSDAPMAWTFQFVRPGKSLLERVSVPVTAFDEGSAWSFRLPLETVMPAPTRRLPGDAASDLPLAAGRQPAAAARVLTVAGTGLVDLADCPRVVR